MISPVDICNQALAHLGDRRIHRLDEDAQVTDAIVRYCAEFYEQAKQEVLAAHRWTFAKKAVALSRSVGDVIFKYSFSHVLPTDMIKFLTIREGEITDPGSDAIPGFDTPTGNFYFEPDGDNILFEVVGEMNGKPEYGVGAIPWSDTATWESGKWNILYSGDIYQSSEDVATPTDVVGTWTLNGGGAETLDLVDQVTTTPEVPAVDPTLAYARKVDQFRIVGDKVWSDTEELGLFYIQNVDDPDQWTPHFRACVARLLASYLAGPVADSPNEVQNQLNIYERITLPNAQFYDAVQDNSNENSDIQTRRARSPLLRARYRENRHLGSPSDEPISHG